MNVNQVRDIARTNTAPLDGPRSLRALNVMVGTTIPAGKVTPLAAFMILREDTLRSSKLIAKVDIMEAVEAVRNGIKVRFQTWFVPWLAFERFDGGMDELNRAYTKTAGANGGAITSFFNTGVLGSAASAVPIHRYLGEHHTATDVINYQNIEAYNAIINHRLKNRSATLYAAKKRLSTNTSLAPAFWQHEQFKYVVPDWDDQAMEGSVELTFTNPKAVVEGIFNDGAAVAVAAPYNVAGNWTGGVVPTHRGSGGSGTTIAKTSAGVNQVFANLATSGIRFSLANLDLAEKIKGYAEAKAQFEGIDDDYIKDLLMQGISVPQQMWKQPILLADKTEIAGLDKRYATDGANLTNAVVNGEAYCGMDIVMPRCPTGGILMVTAEILPDQLWERMRSPNLFITDPEQLPKRDRDDLDPQKVERMSCGDVDTSHATPTALFGYRPMNWWFQASHTRLGGKWHRAAPSNTFSQDRAQFWTPEVTNPTMNADFMLAETINQLPFVVLNQDIGEVQLGGVLKIEGNTVFGPALIENENAYNEVLADVPQTRITKGV